MGDSRFKTVLEPHDEHPHEPDEASNDNESMYLNGFDLAPTHHRGDDPLPVR